MEDVHRIVPCLQCDFEGGWQAYLLVHFLLRTLSFLTVSGNTWMTTILQRKRMIPASPTFVTVRKPLRAVMSVPLVIEYTMML